MTRRTAFAAVAIVAAGFGVGAAYGHASAAVEAPRAVADYWQLQHELDCAPMASAAIIGAVTGHAPTEKDVTAYAATVQRDDGSPAYSTVTGTDVTRIPVILAHYGVTAYPAILTVETLKAELAAGHYVMVMVNGETIWRASGLRRIVPAPKVGALADHALVVSSISDGTVHLVDSATRADETVPVGTFNVAWVGHYAIVAGK